MKTYDKTKRKLKIGLKQTTKVINDGIAVKVYVAKDADEYVVKQIIDLANDNGVEIIYVETMKLLGKACKIDVGAATAAIVK